MTRNRLLRMDNVGIVVESLDEAISFFAELGLKLEGEWAGRVTGLGSQRVEIAMLVTATATAGSRSCDFSPRLQSPITGTPR